MKTFINRKSVFSGIIFLFSVDLYAICDNVTTSGIVIGDENNCASYDPSWIINLTYPSGGTGVLEYQWQTSFDAISWINIAGATLDGYDPPMINVTKYYHRLEKRNGCSIFTGVSNVV